MDLVDTQEFGVSPPIFVIGPPRCGTTLLAKILGRQSRIFMPGETHFFDDINSRRREYGELRDEETVDRVISRLRTVYGRYNEDPDQERLNRVLSEPGAVETLRASRSYKDLLSSFMELQMRSLGKVRWGNNVPKDIFHIDEIISFYPTAKIIICVRDVRDFLCSYKNKWTVASEQNVERLRSLYHPILTSLLWRASVKQLARLEASLPSENLLLVCYEKLVGSPEIVVREICHFIGEEFEAGMLDVKEANSSFTLSQGAGIYSSSVGRWRRVLTNEEAHTAQKMTKQYLARFGYRSEHLKINPFLVASIWTALPFAAWRAVQANRKIRGPLIPYLSRRIAALTR